MGRLGRKRKIAYVSVAGLLLAVVGAALVGIAQENITLTTYYPSPRGVYQQLQTLFNSSVDTSANASSQNVQVRIQETQAGDYARLQFDNNGNNFWHIAGTVSDTTPASSRLNIFYKSGSTGSDFVTVQGAGNVGIGTTNPLFPIEVVRNLGTAANTQYGVGWFGRVGSGGGESGVLMGYFENGTAAFIRQGGNSTGHLDLGTYNAQQTMRLENTGDVGIGTTNPDARLDVLNNGERIWIARDTNNPAIELRDTDGSGSTPYIDFSNDSASGFDLRLIQESNTRLVVRQAADGAADFRVDGNVTIQGSYACNTPVDVSERIVFSGAWQRLPEAGDVVVVDPHRDEAITFTDQAYHSGVAGIVATRPGLLLGAALEGEAIALLGRVPTKVTAENGPIRRGDLLVTASKPGYAMRGDPATIQPGMVIGKALGELTEGDGTIVVLVNLQ